MEKAELAVDQGGGTAAAEPSPSTLDEAPQSSVKIGNYVDNADAEKKESVERELSSSVTGADPWQEINTSVTDQTVDGNSTPEGKDPSPSDDNDDGNDKSIPQDVSLSTVREGWTVVDKENGNSTQDDSLETDRLMNEQLARLEAYSRQKREKEEKEKRRQDEEARRQEQEQPSAPADVLRQDGGANIKADTTPKQGKTTVGSGCPMDYVNGNTLVYAAIAGGILIASITAFAIVRSRNA